MVQSAGVVIPLVKMGSFFCVGIVLLTGAIGGYIVWKNDYDSLELVSRLLNIFVVLTISFFMPMSLLAFLGFLLDAIFATGFLAAQIGAVLGIVPGLFIMRWLLPRVSL